jgi:FkbM family methyltransferase
MSRVAINLPGVLPFELALHRRSDLHICPSLRRHKIWEPVVTAYLRDTVKPGQNAIDIGAHIGYFTLIMSKLVGDSGRVFAFEPEPSNFDLLQTNLRLNRTRNVLAERKAVADRAGRAELHVSDRNTGDHRLYRSPVLRAVHEVATVTLDGYFAGNDGPVHFVKIDTQGLEPKILDGMGTLIERNRPWLALVIEFSPGLLRCSGGDVGDLLSRLERLRATAFWLSEDASGWSATPATAHVLQVIADLMLRTKEEDYSRDIILRFDR